MTFETHFHFGLYWELDKKVILHDITNDIERKKYINIWSFDHCVIFYKDSFEKYLFIAGFDLLL